VARRIAGALVAALVVGAAGTAAAFGADQSRTPVKQPKLSSELAQVLAAELQHGRGLAAARERGLQVVGNSIRVVVESNGTRVAVSSAVQSVGGRFEAWHAGLAQALVAPGALGRLSRAAAVAYVRAPHRLVPQ
jgi:hypothetical protein